MYSESPLSRVLKAWLLVSEPADTSPPNGHCRCTCGENGFCWHWLLRGQLGARYMLFVCVDTWAAFLFFLLYIRFFPLYQHEYTPVVPPSSRPRLVFEQIRISDLFEQSSWCPQAEILIWGIWGLLPITWSRPKGVPLSAQTLFETTMILSTWHEKDLLWNHS